MQVRTGVIGTSTLQEHAHGVGQGNVEKNLLGIWLLVLNHAKLKGEMRLSLPTYLSLHYLPTCPVCTLIPLLLQ